MSKDADEKLNTPVKESTKKFNTASAAGICLSIPLNDGVVPNVASVDQVSGNEIVNSNEGVKLYHYCNIKNLKNNTITGFAKNGIAVLLHSSVGAMIGYTISGCGREIACDGESRIPTG